MSLQPMSTWTSPQRRRLAGFLVGQTVYSPRNNRVMEPSIGSTPRHHSVESFVLQHVACLRHVVVYGKRDELRCTLFVRLKSICPYSCYGLHLSVNAVMTDEGHFINTRYYLNCLELFDLEVLLLVVGPVEPNNYCASRVHKGICVLRL